MDNGVSNCDGELLINTLLSKLRTLEEFFAYKRLAGISQWGSN